MIDRKRRAVRDPVAEPSVATDTPADAPDDVGSELAACVQPLLAMLSAEERSVLEQVELAGQSQAELATAVDVPASTMKSRVQRVRQRLREHFERS